MDAPFSSLHPPLPQALLRTTFEEKAMLLVFSRRSTISVIRETENSQIVCEDVTVPVIATMECFYTSLFDATTFVGDARLSAGLRFQKGIECAVPHAGAGEMFAKARRLHPALFVYAIHSLFLPLAKPFSLPLGDVIAGVLETAKTNSGSGLPVLAA